MEEEPQVESIQHLIDASHLLFSLTDELLERALEEASEGQLSMAQLRLLLLIARPGTRFKVKDVADYLGVTNAAASRSIDRLVQEGLVDRTVTPEDRRAVDLALTPMAEDLLAVFMEVRNRELLHYLGEHPREKISRAAELLDELSVLLVDARGPGRADRARIARWAL
jgi:DNA-binding MarR family transcriptional regulator